VRFYPFAWFAIAAAVFVGWVFLALAETPPPQEHRVRVEAPAHAECVELVADFEYACPDGRVYVVDESGWRDIGPATPVPSVPRG